VRWRKLYAPGPGGFDDAVQVVVQNVDGSEALYSILRDEIGSVIALVAEDETREGAGGTVDPTRPAIPVRYRYSPFGAALAETSPRVERLLFDNELVEVGGLQQADAPERDDAVAAAGALRVWFSAALDAATLGAGVVLESRTVGGAWTEVPAATPSGAEGLVLALDAETGTELRLLLVEGWRRGVAYRVRLRAELRDVLGRAPPTSGPGGSASAAAPLQWTVPEGEGQTIAYEQRFASGERFESWAASGDTVGGRCPGGQNRLFHGLWTDPVTGVAYARARWYDARTGSFLSEDPLRDVDSPNLYQYGLNSPFNYTDPEGLSIWRKLWRTRKLPEAFKRAHKLEATKDLWKRVDRSDVVGVASDGRATVGGRRVHLPRGAEPGTVHKFKSASGVEYDVPISSEGWVDFSNYSKHNLTDFQMTGDSKLDIDRAKRMYKGKTGKDTPAGYTWHHSPDGSTMQLVPTELNQMRHTGGDAVARAAVQKVADEGGFLKSAGTVVTGLGAAALELFAPNTAKADGVGDTSASVVVDVLDTLDPGVQEIYVGLMWLTNQATGLDIEIDTLEDFHDEVLAPSPGGQ
jgi:RHS repeat-associated protein